MRYTIRKQIQSRYVLNNKRKAKMSTYVFVMTKWTLQTFVNTVLSFHCSIALVKFANRGDDEFILVGTVQELMLNPRSCSSGFIHVYQLTENGEKLEFVHRTQVDDVPAAIVSFQGRVLIGVGRYLRVYDLGKKKLLRKCENKVGGFTVGLCEVCGIDTFGLYRMCVF